MNFTFIEATCETLIKSDAKPTAEQDQHVKFDNGEAHFNYENQKPLSIASILITLEKTF